MQTFKGDSDDEAEVALLQEVEILFRCKEDPLYLLEFFVDLVHIIGEDRCRKLVFAIAVKEVSRSDK